MNMTNIYGDYSDTRDCDDCGGEGTVEVEGNYSEATGTCSKCGATVTVNRDEELYYDAAEAAGDYIRDEGRW